MKPWMPITTFMLSMLIALNFASAQESKKADKEARKAAIQQADTNKDGKISFDELKTVRPKLTPEKFAQLDTNGDGFLTKADHKKTAAPAESAKASLRERLAMADTNKDGKVSWEEAKAAMPKLTEERFKSLDTNKDGVISTEDKASAGSDLEKQKRRQEFAKRLQAADANKDGVITREETKASMPKLSDESFKKLDKNGDGVITKEDRKAKK